MLAQLFTVDDATGFQAEQVELLDKLAAYKDAIKKLNRNLNITVALDNSEYDQTILELEVDKFTKEAEYLTAREALLTKIFELYPLSFTEEVVSYFVCVPQANSEVEDVIFVHV